MNNFINHLSELLTVFYWDIHKLAIAMFLIILPMGWIPVSVYYIVKFYNFANDYDKLCQQINQLSLEDTLFK